MKTVAIIQARMSSSRLPGKVMLPLGGGTVLGCVVRRLRRARRLDAIVIATSTDPTDLVIAEWARELSVRACRGPLDDVLARYALAACEADADTVVRITADCPLIDPYVVDAMIDQFFAAPCDYLSNALQRTYPRGLDAEVMTCEALLRASAEAKRPHEREHVTPYLYRDGGSLRLRHYLAPRNLSHQRWTLDTFEDYRFLVQLFELLGDRWLPSGWEEIAGLLDRHPDVLQINRNVPQKQPGE